MQNFKMLLNGELVSAENSFNVINPATEEIIAHCPDISPHQLQDTIEAAHFAFQTWRESSLTMRRDAIRKTIQTIDKNRDELAKLLSQEQGKPLAAALGELDSSIERMRHLCELELPHDILQDDEDFRVEVCYKPYGVVAAICPWNFPVGIALSKIAMATLTGNVVMVKPSPFTPLTTLRIGELIQHHFAKGVVNIIGGSDQIGQLLTEHALVRKINFTGSVKTGQAIANVANHDFKRVTLELGGNDAAIVCDDVDVDNVAPELFWSAFANCGQICIATKRLYVHEKIYKNMIEKLKSIAESVVVGNGLDEKVTMGPLNNELQLNKVINLVEDAKNNGAEIICGGKRLATPGYFYQPTIITHVNDNMRIVKEEQFGPVLPILSFNDDEDVIRRVNQTTMGLGGTVWSKNLERATQLAAKVESGIVWVNRTFAAHPLAPFGGVKMSGIGREGGHWSFLSMLETQTMSIKK